MPVQLVADMPHPSRRFRTARVKYRTGEKIEFPDFTIEYVGERRKSLPVYPRGFLYYDFKVSKANTEKMVSWTTGTGVIDPLDFDIRGKHISSNYAIRISSEN